MNTTRQFLISLCVLGVSLPAAATNMSNALPGTRMQHGIAYLSGGIGRDEAAALKKESNNYPLSMAFSANADDEYLADVDVTIRDSKGNVVLEVPSGGPIMLVKLPEGKYEIAAEIHGKTLRRSAILGATGSKHVYFHWPRA